jgi:hypothetical protein
MAKHLVSHILQILEDKVLCGECPKDKLARLSPWAKFERQD